MSECMEAKLRPLRAAEPLSLFLDLNTVLETLSVLSKC